MAVTDLTGTTWVFESTITFLDNATFNIDFTNNGQTYNKFKFYDNYEDISHLSYSYGNDLTVYVYYFYDDYYHLSAWQNDAYKTITITGGTDVTNATLISWLEGNGTLIEEPEPFYRSITVVAHPDGSITPNLLLLGNKGDKEVTKLTFDISELYNSHIISSLTDMTEKLIIYNPAQPINRSGTYPNPYSITITNDTCIIPEHLTAQATTTNYKLIFGIVEDVPYTAHATSRRESYISNEFEGKIENSPWHSSIEALLPTVEPEEDNAGYVAKTPIGLSVNNVYTLTASTTVAGTKLDSYMTRVYFNKDHDLPELLTSRYGLFKKGNNIYLTKFANIQRDLYNYVCWIPQEVMAIAGEWEFAVIGAVGTQRWISNTIKLQVKDNFLISQDLN